MDRSVPSSGDRGRGGLYSLHPVPPIPPDFLEDVAHVRPGGVALIRSSSPTAGQVSRQSGAIQRPAEWPRNSSAGEYCPRRCASLGSLSPRPRNMSRKPLLSYGTEIASRLPDYFQPQCTSCLDCLCCVFLGIHKKALRPPWQGSLPFVKPNS